MELIEIPSTFTRSRKMIEMIVSAQQKLLVTRTRQRANSTHKSFFIPLQLIVGYSVIEVISEVQTERFY
jgi:hypothetical protein